MDRIAQWLGIRYAKWAKKSDALGWKEEINRRIKMMRPPKLRGVPLEDLRFVVFDTETTGFYPKKGDALLSIGAVVLEKGQIGKQTFHRFINPHRPVPQAVTELTGITQEQADQGEQAVVVIKDFLEFAGTCVLVGHSVDFDICFVNHTLKKLGCQTLNHPALDTYWLARAVYPAYKDLSLDGLLRLYQLEPVGRHTALGDALLTAQVFINLLAKLNKERFYDYFELCNFIQGQCWQQELIGLRSPRLS